MLLLTSRRAVTAILAALANAPTLADEVILRGGGVLRGVVVERTEARVVVETGPGRVTLPMSRVERVVEGRTALEGFRERAAELPAGDADGWAALARWAAERELATQAREAWRRVLAFDPEDAEANRALGRVLLDGVWMDEAEAYRARGYVLAEGRWLTPAEHDALLRERAAEDASAREERETGLRFREAEARAREAEARAAEAEATAAEPVEGGIPLWWGWGGGWAPAHGGAHGGHGGPARHEGERPPRPDGPPHRSEPMERVRPPSQPRSSQSTQPRH